MRVSRLPVFVALACTAWQVGFLVGDSAAMTVSPPLTLASLLLLPTRPAIGATVAIAAALSLPLLGVPSDDPASLLPALASSYSVGRHATARIASWFLPGYAGASTASAQPWLITLVFAFFLLTAIWSYGYLVRRRAVQADDESARLTALQAVDPDEIAAAVVAAERQRLRGEIAAVVRTAVMRMYADAVAAERRFDLERVAAIQSRGTAAIADLRRLLGLLREEQAPSSEAARSRRRSPLLVDSITAAGVAVIMVLVDPTVGDVESPTAPLRLAATVAVAVPLAWRRTAPALAAMASGGALLAAALAEVPVADGFGALILLLLLAWTLGGQPTVAAVGAGALLLAGIITSWRTENLLFNLTVVGLAAFAGYEWRERDRAFARARRSATRLQTAQDQVVARAVAIERLRLARELHDVVSHAVGVMVLQAGAAAAQHPTDPDGAAAALRIVSATGAEALGELHALLGVFNSTESAGTTLTELVARMRATGQPITLDDSSAADEETAAVVYRIVQESLTNAIRHAPGAPVRVIVRDQGGTTVVDVRNGAPTRTPPPELSVGFGLVGLGERVRALGGELVAGPDGDGFRVTATLPARVKEST